MTNCRGVPLPFLSAFLCAMPISIPIGTFLSYLLLVDSSRAQGDAPNCTNATFAWTFNSIQQSPCLVVENLVHACTNESHALRAREVHGYLTLSGSTTALAMKLLEPGTRVPKWAYINSTIVDSWNTSVAQVVGDLPEVIGTSSTTPTSTSTATHTTSASSHSTSPSLISNPHQTSKPGVIAGGVVGGIVGAALIAGVVLWFAFRRRRAHSDMGEKKLSPPQPLAEREPRLYDPSDPTTFPSKEYLPLSDLPLGSTSRTQPSDGGYIGLPEV
ncbi:hypothetical protein EI94DRAFT_1788960 [Lactarius quietus]|nr:hypothetical protein EI94DRAFT_1788960 [Lactarius quietus]